MLDALCLLVLLAFFGLLIWSTVIRPGQKSTGAAVPAPDPLPPSPVGLFCSICRASAGRVNAEEYARILKTGVPVYCEWCITSIEAYKQQQARR
jgi:hypothetical protein